MRRNRPKRRTDFIGIANMVGGVFDVQDGKLSLINIKIGFY